MHSHECWWLSNTDVVVLIHFNGNFLKICRKRNYAGNYNFSLLNDDYCWRHQWVKCHWYLSLGSSNENMTSNFLTCETIIGSPVNVITLVSSNLEQSAYRPRHNTHTALHWCADSWLDNVCDHLITAVSFSDIWKCFDSVDHNILIRKLEHILSLSGLPINWRIVHKLHAMTDNASWSWFFLHIGVPQCSFLGQILFMLFCEWHKSKCQVCH